MVDTQQVCPTSPHESAAGSQNSSLPGQSQSAQQLSYPSTIVPKRKVENLEQEVSALQKKVFTMRAAWASMVRHLDHLPTRASEAEHFKLSYTALGENLFELRDDVDKLASSPLVRGDRFETLEKRFNLLKELFNEVNKWQYDYQKNQGWLGDTSSSTQSSGYYFPPKWEDAARSDQKNASALKSFVAGASKLDAGIVGALANLTNSDRLTDIANGLRKQADKYTPLEPTWYQSTASFAGEYGIYFIPGSGLLKAPELTSKLGRIGLVAGDAALGTIAEASRQAGLVYVEKRGSGLSMEAASKDANEKFYSAIKEEGLMAGVMTLGLSKALIALSLYHLRQDQGSTPP